MTPAARIAADTLEALPPLAPETPAEHLARVVREGPDELRILTRAALSAQVASRADDGLVREAVSDMAAILAEAMIEGHAVDVARLVAAGWSGAAVDRHHQAAVALAVDIAGEEIAARGKETA